MGRTLVMSDIHGMADELFLLLDGIRYKYTEDRLIVLGDYIDRGPNSKDILDYFIKLKKIAGKKLVLLRGNHEDICIKAFHDKPAFGQDATSLWLDNGGDATLKSFGEANLPKYITFMEKLPVYVEMDKYIFVHGGVNPDMQLSQTDPEELLWTRDYAAHISGKTVVVGHSIQPKVTYIPVANTLCVDTGAFRGMYGRGGRLSIVDLTNKEVHWIPTCSNEAHGLVSENLRMWC
jgi:serine/threonine protein phosphatase 1